MMLTTWPSYRKLIILQDTEMTVTLFQTHRQSSALQSHTWSSSGTLKIKHRGWDGNGKIKERIILEWINLTLFSNDSEDLLMFKILFLLRNWKKNWMKKGRLVYVIKILMFSWGKYCLNEWMNAMSHNNTRKSQYIIMKSSLSIYFKYISWGYPNLFNTFSPMPRNATEVLL